MTAEQIKALRDELGLSAQALADKLKVETKTIFSWEAGDSFPTKRHATHMASLRQQAAARPDTAQADAAQIHGIAEQEDASSEPVSPELGPLQALNNPALWQAVIALAEDPSLLAEFQRWIKTNRKRG